MFKDIKKNFETPIFSAVIFLFSDILVYLAKYAEYDCG